MSKTHIQQDMCERCGSKPGIVVVKDKIVCLKCKRELKQITKKGRKNGRIHTEQRTAE